MKKIGMLAGTVGLVAIMAGCAIFSPPMTKDKLLNNIKQAVDPKGKLASVKTTLIVGKVNRGPKLPPGKVTIKVKYPDKWQFRAVVPKQGVFIRSYDGKTGWEFSTKKGYKKLTGEALDELKLQTALAVYRGNLKKVIKSVKFDGEAKAVGRECYKLTVTPKAIYKSAPLTLYVGKKSFLPFMRKELYCCPTGKFHLSTIMTNYKSYDDIMVPMSRILEFNGRIVDITIESVLFNSYIDDADFAPPTSI